MDSALVNPVLIPLPRQAVTAEAVPPLSLIQTQILLRPSAATFPARMHRLSSPSRPLLSFMASATPPWWPPALARRFLPLMVPNPPVSRFPHEPRNMSMSHQVKGHEPGKKYRQPHADADNKHSAATQGMNNTEMIGVTSDVVAGDEIKDKDVCKITSNGEQEDEMSGTGEQWRVFPDGDYANNVYARSSHRDGSIYRGMWAWWKRDYRIADRNETRLEAMALTDPTDCIFIDGTCIRHRPRSMLQFFSLELANIHVEGGLAALYGYIAARDAVDPLLNYVVNFSREDPVIVEQGSLINMVGPKRGIDMCDFTLIEYDMRIKIGEQEKDDLQLIDGASIIGPSGSWEYPYTMRIAGDCGACVLTLARFEHAVEASVEVLISKVQSSFSLSLSCLTSGLDKEIRLFDGAIAESCGLKRSVVAVVVYSLIDLNFEVGALTSSSVQRHCSFEAKRHGYDTKEIMTDFALFSVKVTWSVLPRGT
ncbi:hypothetical protein U9M48_032304 [Paspalum notatum var. saurae]|uniref:DUF6598 domain-containing protein n=1 Tax=Paspalum notatum var. saurae TaxID=547442 RepID=A0AAQ3U933_PASNO